MWNFNSWGGLSVDFGALGCHFGDHFLRSWSLFGAFLDQVGQHPIGGRLFEAFWEDFELDLDLFWIPKVIKRAPKSIPETYRFLRPKF